MQYISTALQVPAGARILVAVSGGPDSVVLLHLLHQSGFDLAIAHANFQLRSAESQRDEDFVRKLGSDLDLHCYVKRFDTRAEMERKGVSIQMAARDMRYQWFDELSVAHGYDFIAVAHHLDDQIETFFINLLRGTGISGLRGIPSKQGKIIRPLLFAFRSDVMAYANEHKLRFVEDSSNRDTDYLRNELRHKLLPLFGVIKPAFRRVMSSNMKHLASAEAFFRQYMDLVISQLIENRGDELWVSVSKLKITPHAPLILHEILDKYGFRTAVTQQIADSLNSQPGKTFLSSTHQVLRDREWLIVAPVKNRPEDSIGNYITEETTEIFTPIHLEIQLFPASYGLNPNPDPLMAFLDFDTLVFPLLLRRWKTGDRFKPLGMKGTMKLSDYFVSRSYSLNQKKEAWILADNSGRIVWIAGQRISDECRIGPSTKTIYQIRMFIP